MISKESRRTCINLLGGYTLATGQITPDHNIIKTGKEYSALRNFFRTQWQTTLSHLDDFREKQNQRGLDHHQR